MAVVTVGCIPWEEPPRGALCVYVCDMHDRCVPGWIHDSKHACQGCLLTQLPHRTTILDRVSSKSVSLCRSEAQTLLCVKQKRSIDQFPTPPHHLPDVSAHAPKVYIQHCVRDG